MASEGAGRSFNRSIALQGATLETVVRVSRSKSPSFPLESANNVSAQHFSEMFKKIAASESFDVL